MRSCDHPTRPGPTWSLAVAAVVLIAGASIDDEKPLKVVASHEAKDRIDQQCTVEMTVRSSKNV